METGRWMGGHLYYSPGRIYGAFVRVRGRLHVVGVCRRGIFWRFGANVFSPVRGYWESMFGLRYAIGNPYSKREGIKLLLSTGMKDERIIVRIRPSGIRGAISFSHTGCINFKLAELDTEIFNPVDFKGCAANTTDKVEAIRGDENSEERY